MNIRSIPTLFLAIVVLVAVATISIYYSSFLASESANITKGSLNPANISETVKMYYLVMNQTTGAP